MTPDTAREAAKPSPEECNRNNASNRLIKRAFPPKDKASQRCSTTHIASASYWMKGRKGRKNSALCV